MNGETGAAGIGIELRAALAQREKAGLLRSTVLPEGLDLTSNDVLGMAQNAELSQAVADAVLEYGVGAGASRLLRGNHRWHQAAETALAAFSGRASALLFPSGFQANLGWPSALLKAGDTLISDALNHASIIDGARLSRAHRVIVAHADPAAVDAACAAARLDRPKGRLIIATESVFSMDGDHAPLTELVDIADRWGAGVMVDEAHATGLYGERGSGLVEALGLCKRVLGTVHTGGKALGVGGAWIAGSGALIETLVNHARSFVFSTASPPALVVGLHASAVMMQRPEWRQRAADLLERAGLFRSGLRAAGLTVLGERSTIVPLVLGRAEHAMSVAAELRGLGFDIRAIRPPTVAPGTSRLRIVVRDPIAQADLDRLAAAIIRCAGTAS